MEPEATEYKLSAQLYGHQEDVRGIGICGEHRFATGSRDKTVRIWESEDIQDHGYKLTKTMTGHSSFVGPVVWIPPNDELPNGGIVSGGMDTVAIVWNIETAGILYTLQGHELQVTSIAVDKQGDILSASVDRTVRRWRKGKTIEVLTGHQGPVQAVLVLPSGEVLTGSSDCTIKIWKDGRCVQTLTGHTDTVRGLALVPGLGILSASHDGSIKLWSLNGEVLLELVGHTAIVYSVAAHQSGVIASGSEDCSVKIWKDGTCWQSIQHPGCVWDVKFLSNGDLITACSDGVARIWSKDAARIASDDEIKTYEAHVVARQSQTKTVGGVNVKDLPGTEALKQPGTKNGQTKIIREGDNAVAYSWNSKDYQWDKIGEVIDGPGNLNDRPTLNGQQYDYVFDVDIGDGVPVRKLPYNRGDNPYTVADRWLLQEDLPLAYREQIVQFILQNTGQNTPVINTAFSDPYTGANAYVPQQQPSGLNGAAAVGGSNSIQTKVLKHIPKKSMLFFDTAQYDGISKKLDAFNSSLAADENKKELALSEPEISKLHSTISILKDKSQHHNSILSDENILPLQKLLLSWPAPMLFPALDILRIALLHPEVADVCAKYVSAGKDILMESLQRAAALPVIDANQLMGIRIAVNCFRDPALRNWISSNRSEVLDMFSECYSSSNKNIRIAYATLLLNYCIVLIEMKDEAGQTQVLSAALEMAGPEEQDPTCRYRALLTLGSLMIDGLMKNVAVDLDVKTIADAAAVFTDSLVSEVGKEIQHVLKI